MPDTDACTPTLMAHRAQKPRESFAAGSALIARNPKTKRPRRVLVAPAPALQHRRNLDPPAISPREACELVGLL